MNTAVTCDFPHAGVSGNANMAAPVRSGIVRTSPRSGPSSTKATVPMNALQRLIRARMAELELTYEELAKRGGFASHTTVWTLVNKKEHRTVPRRATLEKLAKALDMPLDMVRSAAAEAAGYTIEEVPLGSKVTTTLAAAEDVRIVAAAMGELSESDRAKLRRMAVAFAEQAKAERDAKRK